MKAGQGQVNCNCNCRGVWVFWGGGVVWARQEQGADFDAVTSSRPPWITSLFFFSPFLLFSFPFFLFLLVDPPRGPWWDLTCCSLKRAVESCGWGTGMQINVCSAPPPRPPPPPPASHESQLPLQRGGCYSAFTPLCSCFVFGFPQEAAEKPDREKRRERTAANRDAGEVRQRLLAVGRMFQACSA